MAQNGLGGAYRWVDSDDNDRIADSSASAYLLHRRRFPRVLNVPLKNLRFIVLVWLDVIVLHSFASHFARSMSGNLKLLSKIAFSGP